MARIVERSPVEESEARCRVLAMGKGIEASGRPIRPGRRGGARSAATAASLVLAVGCAVKHVPPAVSDAEVEAARRSIAAAAPPALLARLPEEDRAMLATVARRLAVAAQPVCAAHLGRPCRFTVGLYPSAASARAMASAYGWNQVTITAGMVRLAETEDELAAVVGHEFGHHLADHINLQQVRGRVAGMAASTLLGMVMPFGGLVGMLLDQGVSQLGANAARLAYAKSEEREADYLGAYLVARAGYDLERAGGIWVRLSRPEARGSAALPASHLPEAERLAAWRRATEEIRASPDLMPRRRGAS